MNEIREKLIEIMIKVMESDVSMLNECDDLAILEIDSLKYIKLVVEIEDEFDIEIPDEYLDPQSVSSLTDLVELVLKMQEE